MGACVNTVKDGLAEFFRLCRRHLALPRRFGKDRPNQKCTIGTNCGGRGGPFRREDSRDKGAVQAGRTTSTLARPVGPSRDWSNVLLGKVGVVNCYRAINQPYHDLRAAARTIP